VTFVVDKVALEQVFPRVLWIFPVSSIISTFQTHLIVTLINRKNRRSLKRLKQNNDPSKIEKRNISFPPPPPGKKNVWVFGLFLVKKAIKMVFFILFFFFLLTFFF